MSRIGIYSSLVAVLLVGGLQAQAMSWSKQPSKTYFKAASQSRMVYDSARDRVVYFGGWDNGSGALIGHYEYDGTTWAKRTFTLQPSARQRLAMAYDTARKVTVLFGGKDKTGQLKDTWEFDGKAWALKLFLPQSPPAVNCDMVYDSARKVCVLVTWTNPMQVWEWDGKAWTQQKPKALPSARERSALAYDSARKRIICYGGYNLTYSVLMNDTWEYDGITWTRVYPKGSPPKRMDHDIAYDPIRKRTLLYGGQGGTGYNDNWEYDGKAWVLDVPIAKAGKRESPTLCYDTKRSRMLLKGGGYYSDSELWAHERFAGSYTSFGKGCGTPVATIDKYAGTSPKINQTFKLHFTSLPKGHKAAVIAAGFSKDYFSTLKLPLDMKLFGMQGCTLYQSLDIILPMLPKTGDYEAIFPFPNISEFVGKKLFTQSLVLVPNVNPAWWLASNAGELWIGN